MVEPSVQNRHQFVDWFRQSSPYIHAHRGRTFVVYLPGEAIADGGFAHLVHDIALLSGLGIRLVLVHGARTQIDSRLQTLGLAARYDQGLRVTDAPAMGCVKEAVGSLRVEIEAQFSMGLPNSPMAGARLRVVSGNFVTARPRGVRDGIDFLHTGEVRRVDAEAIRRQLDDGAIVLLSCIGYSPTGEAFNLSSEEVAGAAAAALKADKLLLLNDAGGLADGDGTLLAQLSPANAERRVAGLPSGTAMTLATAVRAARSGVRRAHLLSWRVAGGLLLELFTREGVGTLVTTETFEELRQASIEDVGGILELIAPLEAEGVLVRRSRELLETEIERFVVIERDGMVIGCAALYPYADAQAGELACVAVHPDYRDSGRGEALLHFVERHARERRLQRLFVLTTQTAHWFVERGFVAGTLADLPEQRQDLYNFQRASKVFVKPL